MKGTLRLEKGLFSTTPRVICDFEGLTATAFQFTSGVQAVRIENPSGHIIVLPFQGQQVWDAVFHGRRLTMRNFFPEPQPATQLLDSYGAFLFHCGALRMGTPAAEDTHPLHGELPNAPYQEAWLVLGDDAGGPYLGVSGSYTWIKAFGDTYRATPRAVLHRDSTVVDVEMAIENLAHAPMDLMYMCHVNFLPAMNGDIVQATGWSTKDMVLRSSIPSHVHPTPEYLKFMEALKANPEVTRHIRPEDQYNPEFVFYVRNLRHDAKGLTHMMQKHPDGSADYISWDVTRLDHAVRWILIHEDQKVMAMALPSTCDPEGYVAEKKKGNVRTIPPLGREVFSVRAGYLDMAESRRIESLIGTL
ncbi:MAG TPA: DUF4432 family protein [Spirochaetia bacterium]